MVLIKKKFNVPYVVDNKYFFSKSKKINKNSKFYLQEN